MLDYAALLELGISFLETFLGKTKAKLPEEIIRSVEATISALQAHKDDVITKAALEAQRG